MSYHGLDRPHSKLYYIFFKLLFVVLAVSFCALLFYATKSVEYTWRWERVPQYFWASGQQEIRSDLDGTVTEVKQTGTNLLITIQPATTGENIVNISLPANAEAIVSPLSEVYSGEIIANSPYSKPGILLEGLKITITVSAFAIVLGIGIGLLTGLCRLSDNPTLRYSAITYIEIIRGSPLLVQIFLWYFVAGYLIDSLLAELTKYASNISAWLMHNGLPESFAMQVEATITHTTIPPIWYGVIALAIFTGAYVAEIVRAGIQSVSRGQMEAARSLGMTHGQAMRKIILPQAFRRILPPLAGQFISLIKDSSLLGVMAVRELTKATREAVTSSLQSLELWFTCALLYLVLTFTLSLFVQYLERRAIHR